MPDLKNKKLCLTSHIPNGGFTALCKAFRPFQLHLGLIRYHSQSATRHTLDRCASAKKKTPTMEILPDKKELIMKGGTFQEQLSAFQ